jgi:HK97 family phage portal protein
MSLLTRATRALTRTFENRSNPLENPAVSLSNGFMWLAGAGGKGSDAGEWVNETTAMRNTTFFACCRVLTESISSLPLRLLRITDAGRSVATDQNLNFMLTLRPNSEVNAVDFWTAVVLSMASRGNAYCQIVRNSAKEPIELWNLLPTHVEPIRTPQGDLAYRVNLNSDGNGTPNYAQLAKEDVLHFKLMSYNGLKGLDPISWNALAIGKQIAMVKHGARLFANASVPPVVLKNNNPLPMNPNDKTLAREGWESLQTGSNSHRLAILDTGWEISTLALTNEQSQFLQSMEYGRSEICGLMRVPEHMIGSLQRITNSNLEVQNISFVTETLRPYLSRIEQECIAKLLPRTGNVQQYSIEYDTSMLLRGDSAAQAAWYTAGVQGGWMNPAEIRHMLSLNPAPEEAGLTAYRVPVNYMNSELLLDTEPTLVVAEGSTNKANPSAPDGKDVPSAGERQAFRQYGAAYGKLMLHAVRSVVNGANLTQSVGPLLESIADQTAATVGVEPDAQRMVDHLTRLQSRASKWTSENAETIATDELRRAVKAFVFGAHEDAARAELAVA